MKIEMTLLLKYQKIIIKEIQEKKNIYEERIKKLEELDKKKDVEITLLKGAIEHMKAEIEKLKDLTNIFNLFYNYICIYD